MRFLSLSDPAFLINTQSSLDPDAAAYITAVETADGQALEAAVVTAINDFVVGCKADGIWAAIKASCIMASARTLAGALQPLVGTAPTNFNFVSGDYDRKTGLRGNTFSKYLRSGYNNNNDPQDDAHRATYTTSAPTTGFFYGASYTSENNDELYVTNSTYRTNSRGLAAYNTLLSPTTGLTGISRESGSNYSYRIGGVNYVVSATSGLPQSRELFIFTRNFNGSSSGNSNARLAFYSIGEALDLALLDTRVSTLMTAIDGAIP